MRISPILIAADGTKNKVCSKCRVILPLSEEFYHKKSSSNSGFVSECKVCTKDKSRKYRDNNLEAISSRKKEFYNNNKDKIIPYVTAWVEDNIEKSREYKRKWREENPEAMRAARQNWKKENPLKLIQYKNKRRAILAGLKDHHTEQDILDLLVEANNKCYYCKKSLEDFHVDHKTPLSRGGSNTKENLAISCPSCNYAKWTKTEEEYVKTLL